jgi:hypothetical protein
MITNSWIETGILTCRLLIKFLEAKPSNHHDDVLITMFKDAKGENLSPWALCPEILFPIVAWRGGCPRRGISVPWVLAALSPR